MSQTTNAHITRSLLVEHFQNDSTILQDISCLLGFAAAASSGEPMSLMAGLALILKTASAAVSAGASVVKRLSSDQAGEKACQLPPYDRFKVLLYVTCVKCFVESVHEVLDKAGEASRSGNIKFTREQEKALREELKKQTTALDDSEVTYRFCFRPESDSDLELFDNLAAWLRVTLHFYGLSGEVIQKVTTQCAEKSRQRFYGFLSKEAEESKWIRTFLGLVQHERESAQIMNDLASIRQTLQNWTSPGASLRERQEQAWRAYREDLKRLPDDKESMFNESFGVRKVFLQPQVNYHIAGASGRAGRPSLAPDLGRLLGALTSSRVSGEDLIILCGGPGSGKSTLCRVLASELAANPEVFPVFLRLRTLKEGSDITTFVEQHLRKLGLIQELVELRDIPNLILILDGFDELVMASRSRLRQFFNVLRDEHSTGLLRTARIIVSGRDTLFPNGEGLPAGSHVLSILPFDRERVKAWGEKWRNLHKGGSGSTFRPEGFMDENLKEGKKPPLHYLVTWPLTLHLVARVQTRGHLDIGGNKGREIQKAYLYRSIMADTASRQASQAAGKGRLEGDKMREFLRDLAWEMFMRSSDSLDPSEVVPILSRFYPRDNDADLSELADVSIVNSPELTKGEETGFEFVHKSFAEFLVAERMALSVEHVSFVTEQYGTTEKTWRMTDQEAASELAPFLSLRLIPEDVQEMLEPMLGCLKEFSKGDRIDEFVNSDIRREGLERVITRFEMLLATALKGRSVEISSIMHAQKKRNQIDAFTDYCAGLLLIGTAAARHYNELCQKANRKRFLNLEAFPGAFWKLICLLGAGGVTLNANLSGRLFAGASVARENGEAISEVGFPTKMGYLNRIQGYRATLDTSYLELVDGLLKRTLLADSLFVETVRTRDVLRDKRRLAERLYYPLLDVLLDFGRELHKSGIVDEFFMESLEGRLGRYADLAKNRNISRQMVIDSIEFSLDTELYREILTLQTDKWHEIAASRESKTRK